MITKKIIEAAWIAYKAHEDQVDKIGKPYIEHPKAVVDAIACFKDFSCFSTQEQELLLIGAWLHDAVEDSHITLTEISSEFGNNVAEIVELLTHDKDVTYKSYIENVSTNKLASIIKVADLMHNTSIARYAFLEGVALEKFLNKIGSKYIPALIYLSRKWGIGIAEKKDGIVKWGE